ncbi:MAG: LicD family protein [Synergistaceae bacterium]|nr:LicD family protein [Synergistaceae bacterium]
MNTDKNRLTLKIIQFEELCILLKVREFFERHGIRYCLCGGTLLGAVRHGGFIPWDDDIDIFVPREDFERFREMASHDRNIITGLNIYLPCDENYVYPFIKVCNPSIVVESHAEKNTGIENHLWIDIFPMDHLPDNAVLHWVCLWFQQVQKKSLRASMHSEELAEYLGWRRGIFRRFVSTGAKMFCKCLGGAWKIARNLDAFAKYADRKYSYSQHVGDAAWPNGMNDYFREDWIFPTIKMTFEGQEFDAPHDYDSFLRHFYGDYMTPPPEDERNTHYLTAYRIDA